MAGGDVAEHTKYIELVDCFIYLIYEETEPPVGCGQWIVDSGNHICQKLKKIKNFNKEKKPKNETDRIAKQRKHTYMCTNPFGLINRLSPTSACPVA